MSIFDLNFNVFNKRVLLTLNQFLLNPTGKKSSMMAKRENIRKDLVNRYNALLKKYGAFKYTVYKDADEHYFFHFLIPSETFDNFFYDVVLEFVPDETKFKNFATINEYSMNFFSNSPHMTFTYTYVLNEGKIIIEILKVANKYSNKALTSAPKVTNPIEIFGFEKTCYYASLFIADNSLTKKEEIEKHLTKLEVTEASRFVQSIMSQEQKFLAYTNRKKAFDLEHRKKKKNRAKSANKKAAEASKNFNIRSKAKSAFKSVFSKIK